MAKGKVKKIERYRDAETGEYVKQSYAEKHPKKTVKETDKIIVKPKK
ncbi:MAG: multidrug transporter [Saprospiraceae bacterium]|nr:multidrug transporter [Saprospiraceae bacterium]